MPTEIHDTFVFYNELDILEIRLHELFHVVDRFVLVEGSHTFTGQPKPSFFQDNLSRYRPYLSKIEHVMVRDWPDNDDPWQWEFHQRNRLISASSDLKARDIIICSDADEIPSREATATLKDKDEASFVFEQAFSYFTFDYLCQDLPLPHAAWSLAERKSGFDRFTVNDRRSTRQQRIADKLADPASHDLLILRQAGWHASYLGDDAFVRNKIRAFSHQEYNQPGFLETINVARTIENGADLYGREDVKWRLVKERLAMPHLVTEAPARFATYLAARSDRLDVHG